MNMDFILSTLQIIQHASKKVEKFFPERFTGCCFLHPHPSLVPILSLTRWTVQITQPWRASACIGRQACQHLGGHYFSPRR